MADIELSNRFMRQDEPTTNEQDSASAVPLPASATSSLEHLRLHHIAPATQSPATPSARSIALPESLLSELSAAGTDGSISSIGHAPAQSSAASQRNSASNASVASRQPSAIQGNGRPPQQIWSYITWVEPLLRSMPHLEFVTKLRDCRNERAGEVRSVDVYEHSNLPTTTRIELVDQSGNFASDQLRALDTVANDNIATRLVVADDLSPKAICSLGSVFGVDPELFAAHLYRSRYLADSAEEQKECKWSTAALPKSFASVQWYRPVHLSGDVARWLDNSKQRRSLFGGETFDAVRQEMIPPITWEETRFERSDRQVHVYSAMSVGSIVQSAVSHRIQLLSNIFRQSWLLSAKPATDFENRVPMAWEEKASIFMVEGSAVPTVVLLVDPIPSILDRQQHEETRLSVSPVPRKHTSTTSEYVSIPAFLPPDARNPIELPANRLDATEEQIERFRLAAEPASTASAITSWLTSSGASADPLVALLEVVYRDSVGFFDSLEICLKEISEDSLDDYLMSQRLSEWRRLMNDFETSVAEIKKSLHNFVASAFRDQAARPDRVDFMLTDLDARNAQFSQRIEKSYNALRAEMGVFESRRSIAEAETVTKLTELAFLFIPLTFCCGLYSMQVYELRNGVPLTTFVITAVIVFVICYGARLVLRSTIVTESGQTAREILWA